MNPTKDEVYLCYVAIGPHYIHRLVSKVFPTLPSSINIVVLTNTPHLLNEVNVTFNLKIVDIETLRDEWSRSVEILIKQDTECEYFSELDSIPNYKFPLGLYRYGLKWAVDNNISKLVLLDTGCTILNGKAFDIVETDSIIISPQANVTHQNDSRNNRNHLLARIKNAGFYEDIFLKHSIDSICYSNNSGKYLTQFDGKEYIQIESLVDFEGWILGYIFSDVNKLKMLFEMWDEAIRNEYSGKHTTDFFINAWAVSFELMLSPIHAVFNLCLDTTIIGASAPAVVHTYTFGTSKDNDARKHCE